MLVAVLLAALAAGPDYDAFSDSSGHIADERQLEAAQAMVRDPEQLEAVCADALKGNARAARVFQELETRYFPDIGRAVAEREAQPKCLVPVYRELSGQCIPDWSFLDFLRHEHQASPRWFARAGGRCWGRCSTSWGKRSLTRERLWPGNFFRKSKPRPRAASGE